MIPRVTTLPALVLGPPMLGAPWKVLTASPVPALNKAQDLRLHEIMASLAYWADSGEAPIVALLPLGDGLSILLRAAGGGAIGPNALAQANGVILTADMIAELGGRAERLLAVLPAPDGGRNFGRSPWVVPPVLPPLPLRIGWEDIGLAWCNRIMLVPESADVLPTLATVLANAGPPEQAGRVRGWATSAILPAAGGFDPWDECQLIVLGPGRDHPYGMPHLAARLNLLGEPEPVVLPPATWRAWAAFREIAGADAVLPWDFDMSVESVPALLARLADHADAQRGNRTALVGALLAGRGQSRSVLRADLKAAGLNLLAGWLEQDGAADLAEADFLALGRPTLLAALSSLDAPLAALARMAPSRVLWLAEGLADHVAATGLVGSAAALWLAQHAPQHPALPAIVAARLEGPEGFDLARLASVSVLDALGPDQADLALRLTAAGLRRPAGSIAAIAASLAALGLGAGQPA